MKSASGQLPCNAFGIKDIPRSVLDPADSAPGDPDRAINADAVQPVPGDVRGLILRGQRPHPVPQGVVALLLTKSLEVARLIVSPGVAIAALASVRTKSSPE